MFVVMPFAAVQACGPDWKPDTFVRNTRPDDLKSFAAGRLGILQSGFDSNELAVAYRYLNGGRLSEKEQKEYLPAPSIVRDWRTMTSEQIQAARAAEEAARPVNQWRAARAKYMPKETQGAAAGPALPESYGAYDYFYDPEEHRCPDPAFRSAALTLDSRAASWGKESPWLVDWIRAQDAVFSNCAGKSAALPARAPEGSPALLKADRRYQDAAAAFYAGQVDEARERFEAVAQDQGSSWRYLGQYLAARALVRKAFAMSSKTDPWSGEVAGFDRKTMQAAQTMLEGLLKQHDPALKRETILAELNFVRMRTEPEKRVAEICAALAGPGADDNFGQDLSDLNYVLVKQIQVKDPPPLLAWIRDFRASTANDAIDRWKDGHALPSLVVAIMKAKATDASVTELLSAAARIKPGEPPYDTVAFHRIRVLTELGRADEARVLLDGILPGLEHEAADSRVNAFRGERVNVARTLDEFLKYAPRTLLEINSQGAGSLIWECSASAAPSPRQSRCPEEGRTLKFDEDAAFILNRQIPLALLVEAAKSASLPKSLQQEVTLAAWTRSVVLEDAASAAQLAPLLPEAIRKTAGSGTGFPAVLAILRNPGLRPYIEPGITHLDAIKDLDHFRDNWWCGDWQGQFEHDPWAEGTSRPAAFLNKEQQAVAAAEYAKLRTLPCATVYLGRRVIDYAKANSADPDVPEALALTVRGTRYACTEWGSAKDQATENSAVSKAAFRLLHSNYPKSSWTVKTPYYF
jgi:hypothetical protein